MKKLVVMAFATTMVFVATAAQIDWSIAGKTVYQQDGTTYWGGNTYYVVNTSVSTWATILAGIQDGSVNAGNISSSAAFVESRAGNSASKSSGAVAAHSVSAASLTEGGDAALAYVLFQTVSGTDYYFVSGTSLGTAYDPSGSIDTEGAAASFNAVQYSGGSGWTAVSSVPEPTSGLLMLVGLGALALRRRRA